MRSGIPTSKVFLPKEVDEGKVAQQMKCSVSLQCRTRSAGPACTKAIEDVCNARRSGNGGKDLSVASRHAFAMQVK